MSASTPSFTLIVTTYNWIQALEMVLLSVLRQSVMPDELIIADDGSRDDTREFIESFIPKFNIPVHHVWHEDDGYRRCAILNKAIQKASSDYIAQVDGDVILHKNYVADQKRFAKPGVFMRGYRVMLDEETSKRAMETKTLDFGLFVKGPMRFMNALYSPLLTSFTHADAPVYERVYGSHISYWREDVLKVNGYNEDISGWGCEDTEFVARLIFNGINRRKLKFAAKQYHLYHPEVSRDRYNINDAILQNTLNNKLRTCANGILKEA